jgi:hypothetical protein
LPKTLEYPSAGEREKTASLDSVKSLIGRIDATYKENPNYVGIISGRAGAITQLTDDKESLFRRDINDVKDMLLRARSGAQINEQEYARLSKLVPDYTDSKPQFKGKMKGFNAALDDIISARQKAQAGGGVVPPMGAGNKGAGNKDIKSFWK